LRKAFSLAQSFFISRLVKKITFSKLLVVDKKVFKAVIAKIFKLFNQQFYRNKVIFAPLNFFYLIRKLFVLSVVGHVYGRKSTQNKSVRLSYNNKKFMFLLFNKIFQNYLRLRSLNKKNSCIF